MTFVTMTIAHDLNFLVRSTGRGAIWVLKQPHHNAQKEDISKGAELNVQTHGALGFTKRAFRDR